MRAFRTLLPVLISSTLLALAAPASAAPGDLDPAFGSNGIVTTPVGPKTDKAVSVALQSDGKIVVAGYSFNGASDDFAVARYNMNGTLDGSFGTGGIVTTSFGAGNDHAHAVAIDASGNIVVGGYTFNGTNTDFALARYNTNGTLDSTFGGNGKVSTAVGTGNDEINGLAIDASGNIVVGGQTAVGTFNEFVVARYTSTGGLDGSFGSGGEVLTDIGAGSDAANSVAIQPDGMILAGGRSNNGDRDFAIARYTTTGALDPTFGNAGVRVSDFGLGDDYINALAIQPDGKIVAAGTADNGTNTDFALARYTANGTLDPTFGGTGKVTTNIGHNDEAFGVAIQTDGKIVAAGVGGSFYFGVARYNADGTLDTSFGTNGTRFTAVSTFGSDGFALAIQPTDGNIVVVGDAYGAGYDFALARYLVGPAVPSYQPDGSIKLGKGSFVGDNIYNSAGTGESVVAGAARGTKKSFTVRIENDGSATDSITVLGAGAQKGFAVTYKRGSANITSQVLAGTFTVSGLAPGGSITITLSIAVKSTAAVGSTHSWLVGFTSTTDAAKKDGAVARVKVKA